MSEPSLVDLMERAIKLLEKKPSTATRLMTRDKADRLWKQSLLHNPDLTWEEFTYNIQIAERITHE